MGDFFKWLKGRNWFAVCILFLAMMGVSAIDECESKRMKKAQEEFDSALYSMSLQPVPVATLDDSSTVYAAQVATVSGSEIKKLPSKALLRDISVKPSQVAAVDITASTMRDSVRMRPPDSLLLAHGEHPSTFSYRDKWVDFSFSLSDSVLRYSVRDSVTTVVVREYRHRFLWWRWGTKGYHVKVVNHNPHSTLLYKKFVKKE